MNKGELIDAVATELGETKTAAARAVEAVLRAIIEGVSKDEKVAIAGFGTFRRRRRKGRKGINPSTKQEMVVREATTLGFTASQSLRNQV